MKIEIRYRDEDELSSVHAFYLHGESLSDIGELAVKIVSEGAGVFHQEGGETASVHAWTTVYTGKEFFIEVVAHEDES